MMTEKEKATMTSTVRQSYNLGTLLIFDYTLVCGKANDDNVKVDEDDGRRRLKRRETTFSSERGR